MEYNVGKDVFTESLGISETQADKLDKAILRGIKEMYIHDSFNIDKLNAFVAPYIESQEEAFYIATNIATNLVSMKNDIK